MNKWFNIQPMSEAPKDAFAGAPILVLHTTDYHFHRYHPGHAFKFTEVYWGCDQEEPCNYGWVYESDLESAYTYFVNYFTHKG